MIDVNTTVVVMVAAAAQQLKQLSTPGPLADLSKRFAFRPMLNAIGVVLTAQSFGRDLADGRKLTPVLVNSVAPLVQLKQLSTPGPLTDLSKPYGFISLMSGIAHSLSTSPRPLAAPTQGVTISSSATGFWA
jgi:hypothetical protein